MNIARPFVKWVGGKRALAAAIIKHIGPVKGTYYEPFLGSGAVFFALWSAQWVSAAHLSDINTELILTYKVVKEQRKLLVETLNRYLNTKSFYYNIRSLDTSKLSDLDIAARLIYLNKTCYNGLYRVNRRGQFNVPFGNNKRTRFVDPDALEAAARALQIAILQVSDFEPVIDRAGPGDVIYCDPPYLPLPNQDNFTAYQQSEFDLAEHRRLRDACLRAWRRGATVIVSNSSSPDSDALYGDPPFVIYRLSAPRVVAANAARRGHVTEILAVACGDGTCDQSPSPSQRVVC